MPQLPNCPLSDRPNEIRVGLPRRSFLKAGLGTVLYGCAGLRAVEVTDDTYDVVVVGAGMAGLNAARTLKAAGLSVVVLEASGQHGGRVQSKTLGSTRVEMGAEEHYPKRNNPVYPAIVEAFGKEVYTPLYEGLSGAVLDGGRVCYGDCRDNPAYRDFQKYFRSYWRPRKPVNESLTMAEDIAQRYGVRPDDWAYSLYENGLAGAVYSTSLDKIGMANLARDESNWALSEDVLGLTPANLGYLDALDQIWWDDILDVIRFNRPVTQIEYGPTGVRVTDTSGEVFRGRYAIVTASIGVLQSEQINFQPSLPPETVIAYRNIGMGQGMKVALRFSKPFWPDDLNYLVTEGITGVFWVPTAYKVDSPDSILMLYPMGNQADALSTRTRTAGKNADAFIIETMLEALDRLFLGAASKLYLDGLVRDYTAEPYILGAYSYPMPTQDNQRLPELRNQLRKPVAGRLYFAGEATSKGAPATVPGALMEGERAAREIIRASS